MLRDCSPEVDLIETGYNLIEVSITCAGQRLIKEFKDAFTNMKAEKWNMLVCEDTAYYEYFIKDVRESDEICDAVSSFMRKHSNVGFRVGFVHPSRINRTPIGRVCKGKEGIAKCLSQPVML